MSEQDREIERLRAALAENDRVVVGLGRDRERLTAEHGAYRAEVQTREGRWATEIERLRAELDLSQGNYATLRSSQLVQQQEYEEQERKVERLRAALENIMWEYEGTPLDWMAQLAREGLSPHKAGEIERLRAALTDIAQTLSNQWAGGRAQAALDNTVTTMTRPGKRGLGTEKAD